MTAPLPAVVANGAMPRRPKNGDRLSASEFVAAVGERLRLVHDVIEAQHPQYTQSALARHFNVDQSTYNKWLAGTRLPPPYVMAAFCDFSGCTLDFLYRGRLGGLMSRALELHLVARLPALLEADKAAAKGGEAGVPQVVWAAA